MNSILIQDTTCEEREAIVEQSLGALEAACDGCSAGLAEMYQGLHRRQARAARDQPRIQRPVRLRHAGPRAHGLRGNLTTAGSTFPWPGPRRCARADHGKVLPF